MEILKLKLKKYRNCKDIELDLNSKKILIIGKNAQGKTNILESIYFLSALKSQRTSNILELINFGQNKLEISAEIKKSGTEIDLDYSFDNEKKKEIKVNKLKTRPKEFKSVLKTVIFSTQDLLLLRGTPQDRREWLDTAISQIYPAYDDRLTKYNKVRIQKNNLLKEYNNNEVLLEVYNEQLSVLGSNIIYLRKKFLKEIEKIAQDKHFQICSAADYSKEITLCGSEKLTIKYDCNFLDQNGELEIDEISQKFHQKLEDRKKDEIQRGQALVGPHRDDIIFYINGQESTKFASQGQQRTIVLSLKLAELDIITQKTGEPPVLLLDDVLAELDDIRQNYLLTTINENTQTIITSVDTLLFDEKFLEGVMVYKIENGSIIKE